MEESKVFKIVILEGVVSMSIRAKLMSMVSVVFVLNYNNDNGDIL